MIFGHTYLISGQIFKLLVALFRTELQKDDMVIFFLWCFIKVRFRKMQFLKDGVQTVELSVNTSFLRIIIRQFKIKTTGRLLVLFPSNVQ